jgi:hypothetical protein
MKKLISFCVTIFAVSALFAAARPSLDGRALVADEGTMPKGLFARTVGYLPGDSVTVTNPATGAAVDVLILGAIDPSEGVAILLSPEAADKLQIKKDSNVQVKITKRTGRLDETVSGTAVLASGDDTAAKSDAAAPEVAAPDATLSTEDTAAAAETAPVPATTEAVPAENTDSCADTASAEAVPVDGTTDSLPLEDIPAAETAGAEPAAEPQPPAEQVASEEIPPASEPDKEIVAAEPVGTAQPAELSPAEKVAETEAPVPETAVASEPVNEESPAPASDNSAVQPVAETPPAADAVPAVEPAYEESPVAAEPATETVLAAAEPANNETYAPIVLVPSESNPPAAEAVVPETPASTVVVTPEPAVEPAAPVITSPTAAPVTAGSDMNKYLVPSLKELKSERYYVQIASLAKEENIRAILDKYGKKYPLVLVPLSTGTGYQVMVGPLSVDEYGTILERFKSYGYKDLFLRKIK